MHFTLRFFSVWPCVAILLAILLAAGTPAFARLDAPGSHARGRLATLDGLRGFLALGVFFHHAVIYHGWLTQRVWVLPPSRFYASVGQVGVALFFMITGYLFWGKLIAEGGAVDWLRLYVGRIFRLGPVYLLAIAGMLLVLLVHGGWQLREPPRVLLDEIGRWLALGALTGGVINADGLTGIVLAGVTWTLRYEWLFYASLPWLSIFARGRWWHLGASALGLLLALRVMAAGGIPDLVSGFGATVMALFGFGMVTASLHAVGWRARLPLGLGSLLAAGLLALAFATGPIIYTLRPMLALGGAFYLIASGASLFGLLLGPGAQRLGHVSYGIYLMQGLALATVFAPDAVEGFALRSPAGYWLVVGAAATLLVLAAAAAHVTLERPGMACGRLVADRLLGRRPKPAGWGSKVNKSATVIKA